MFTETCCPKYNYASTNFEKLQPLHITLNQSRGLEDNQEIMLVFNRHFWVILLL